MGIPSYQYEEMRRRTERNAMREPQRLEAQQAQDEVRDLHEPILRWLEQNRCPYVYSRPDKKTHNKKGVCDFVFAYKGKTYWIECKTATGELKPAQNVFMRQLLDQGIHGAIVRSMPEFFDIFSAP